MLLLLAHASPAGPGPATSPCPPREKGGGGCLIFPGWASSQTTRPCYSHRRGHVLHSLLPWAVDSSHTYLSPSRSQSSTGFGLRRQAGDWGLSPEVQFLSHCRSMMGRAGIILTLEAESSSVSALSCS